MPNYAQYPGQGPDAYDASRQRLQQQQGAQANDNMQALQRRYASMGGQNSGAYLAQAAQQQRNDSQDQAQGQAGINAEQTKEANQMNFQHDQAQNAMAFQGKQNEANRDIQRSQVGIEQQKIPLEQRRLDQEDKAMQINQAMNEWQQKHSGGFLGGGGFLGTGIGN